jgi:hypothetical protein
VVGWSGQAAGYKTLPYLFLLLYSSAHMPTMAQDQRAAAAVSGT